MLFLCFLTKKTHPCRLSLLTCKKKAFSPNNCRILYSLSCYTTEHWGDSEKWYNTSAKPQVGQIRRSPSNGTEIFKVNLFSCSQNSVPAIGFEGKVSFSVNFGLLNWLTSGSSVKGKNADRLTWNEALLPLFFCLSIRSSSETSLLCQLDSIELPSYIYIFFFFHYDLPQFFVGFQLLNNLLENQNMHAFCLHYSENIFNHTTLKKTKASAGKLSSYEAEQWHCR